MSFNTATANDEISLVDLTVLLVKRWKTMFSIFLLVMLATVAVVVLRPVSYSYTSIYAIAEYFDEEGELVGVEAPEAVLAKLNIVVLPSQTRAYLNEKGWDSLPFNVSAQLLKGTNLISLSSQASQTQADDIEALHQRVIESLATGQATLIERKRAALERRLTGMEEAMRAVGVSAGVLAEPANAIRRKLDALQDGEVEQVAVRSTRPEGTGSQLIIALGAVLALMLAVIGAFACHFVTAVRHSLANE